MPHRAKKCGQAILHHVEVLNDALSNLEPTIQSAADDELRKLIYRWDSGPSFLEMLDEAVHRYRAVVSRLERLSGELHARRQGTMRPGDSNLN